jgi:hypothetical protein
MNKAIFGRGPNGRALRRDGTERKERRTLTAAERISQLAAQTEAAHASIGRSIFNKLPGMSAFVSGIGTFRRWIRDARAYSTEEARAARRAYFQRQLDIIDAKGEAAEAWLPNSEKVAETISGLYRNIGNGIEAFIAKHERVPNDAEASEIISKYLSDDVKELVEKANDPANDVFVGFRRGDDDGTEDTEEDADTLD